MEENKPSTKTNKDSHIHGNPTDKEGTRKSTRNRQPTEKFQAYVQAKSPATSSKQGKVNTVLSPTAIVAQADVSQANTHLKMSDTTVNCSGCGSSLKYKETLYCQRCKQNFCPACTAQDPKDIASFHTLLASWYCKPCRPKAMNAIHTDKEIEDRCNEYFAKIENRLIQVEKDVAEKADKEAVEERLQNIEKRMNELQVDEQELIREMREIEEKKDYLIIHGLKHNDTSDTAITDTELVNNLFETALQLNHKAVSVMRLGAPPSTTAPLKVKTANMKEKKEILAKATSLRKLEAGHRFADVYIRPDMTKKQREQSKNLHTKLRETRLKYPDKTYKIKYGKIIEVTEEE